jgi:cell division protein FtsL
MTSWFSEAVATPAPRTRTRTNAKPKANAAAAKPRARAKRRPRTRGAIVWIVISAAVLAGVVFVNLAVLRLNLELDSATQQRTKLQAENATLSSELSRSLASQRIQNLARRQDGLVEAGPAVYVDLSR